jgi:ice-binding like protein
VRWKEFHAWQMMSLALVLLAGCHGSGSSGNGVGGSEGRGPISLGRASSYGVLAGTYVANTGVTEIFGALGVSPGKIVTGFPTVHDTIDLDSLKSAFAQEDLAAAFDDAAGRSEGAVGVSGDLGARTLTPGLYSSSSALSISGTLTLDARGDPNALFIIQVPSTLTTGAGSRVALIGSADAFNVTWVVLGSAVLGASSGFEGSILAGQSITLGAGATIEGRALARSGAVILDSNTITAR